MRRAGIVVTSRRLRYRIEQIRLPDGATHDGPVQREKGIDLRLGLDVVRMARNGDLDVAREVRDISRTRDLRLKVVSAFPYGPNASTNRGIDRTDWFRMDLEFYSFCLDPRDYRPRR